MRTGAVRLVVAFFHLISGDTVTPVYKGCFSTSVVQQYAFYYKYNESLTLEQCIAACNNRLTRYMGLETDESSTNYNHVFCGNDLAEVSLKADINLCSPCPDNSTFYRGRNGFMAVYLLRDLTPLSLLLATNYGVDMLSDNATTVRVPYLNTYIHPSVDYIYTKDTILFAVEKGIPTSFYNPLTMKFSEFEVYNNVSDYYKDIAINFLTTQCRYGITVNYTMNSASSEGPNTTSQMPPARITTYYDHVLIDPYNNTVVAIVKGVNKIRIGQLNDSITLGHSLQYLHVDTMNALAMDIHEMLLYVILTFTGDTSTFLVSLDYRLCQVRVLFHGPKLENATGLEVFRDDAVWLRDDNGVTTVYHCKLTLKCELVTEYQSNQKIHDFVIYHPEKQTPGRKRLCANMTCSHDCQLFTPFSARCKCPPGMKLGPNNSTCVWLNPLVNTNGILKSTSPPFDSTKNPVHCTTWSDLSLVLSKIKLSKNNAKQTPTKTTTLTIASTTTSTTVPTTTSTTAPTTTSTTVPTTTSTTTSTTAPTTVPTTTSTTKSTKAPTTTTTTTSTTASTPAPTTTSSTMSTTAFTTLYKSQNVTPADYADSTVSVLTGLPTEDIRPPITSTETPKNNKTPSCETRFYESHSVCIVIILFLLMGIGLLVIKLYQKVTYYPHAVEEKIGLKNVCST